MRKIVTPYNFSLAAVMNDEPLDDHSEVVPDQALTVREIITRHSRGLSVPSLSNGDYFDEQEPDTDVPDYFDEGLDLVERDELQNDLKSRITSFEASLRARLAKGHKGALANEQPTASEEANEPGNEVDGQVSNS